MERLYFLVLVRCFPESAFLRSPPPPKQTSRREGGSHGLCPQPNWLSLGACVCGHTGFLCPDWVRKGAGGPSGAAEFSGNVGPAPGIWPQFLGLGNTAGRGDPELEVGGKNEARDPGVLGLVQNRCRQGGDKIHFDKLERSPSGLTEVPQGQALLGRNCKVSQLLCPVLSQTLGSVPTLEEPLPALDLMEDAEGVTWQRRKKVTLEKPWLELGSTTSLRSTLYTQHTPHSETERKCPVQGNLK
ncbi:transcription termination factor 2, mitochondrial isoform X3 [Manis javanica]|uniref:transcription termination factor 2, mitochondrial isoform X3 n=1 Tax=Manis javanica TaxID=9974 RepID=UPI003C6CE880